MDQTSAKIDEAFPAEINNDRFVRGLDTIRFVCALWVTIGHMGLPALPFLNKSTVVGKMIIGAYHSVFSGPSAVIVFFVISGLCIHLPHVQDKAIPDLRVYFTRRYVRIMIPMLAAIGIANHLLSYELSLFEKSILWSLLCELIYYTVYPALLAAAAAGVSWRAMAVVSFVLAIIVAATEPIASPFISWFCKMLFALVLSFGFAVLFEWPSHRLARRTGNYISATA